MKPFEQMTEAERMEHLLGPHELPDDKAMYEGLSEQEFIECHQIDHDEWLADDHQHSDHDCNPAHERIWHDPDVRLEQEVVTVREHEVYGVEPDEMSESWMELAAGRPIRGGKACEFGFAEEVIGLLEFSDGTFLVGIGESLRPFQQLYEGRDGAEAERQFQAAVDQHSGGSDASTQ